MSAYYPTQGGNVLVPINEFNDLMARHEKAPDAMTVRDRFAMAALTALITSNKGAASDDVLDGVRGGARISKAAFMYADAMMKERQK